MSAIKGWEGALRVGDTIANAEGSGSDINDVQSISPSHGNNVEALYEIGSRSPTEVKEGNIDLSMDITLLYTGGTTFSGYAGVGSTGALTKYYVAIYPTGAVAVEPEIRMYGSFNDWSLDMSQDGVLTETVTFVGESIAVGAAFLG